MVATGFEPAKFAQWLLRPPPLTAREHYQNTYREKREEKNAVRGKREEG
jgi:hypothetical protein